MSKYDPDKLIELAISIYNAEGYPEGEFEMLDHESSHRFCLKAKRLMDAGYRLVDRFSC